MFNILYSVYICVDGRGSFILFLIRLFDMQLTMSLCEWRAKKDEKKARVKVLCIEHIKKNAIRIRKRQQQSTFKQRHATFFRDHSVLRLYLKKEKKAMS